MNALQSEKSPYLLQHSHNPVNWYPWCGEAFQRAREEDKPVFLSIGYSTCHWCHVMAHESFENDEIAALLNTSFISVKVDREERPDIDAVYMEACQALTGSGGWPLTLLLTPEQKPFWAGTYLPRTSRYGLPGLMELLSRVARQWKTQRHKLISASEELTRFLAEAPEHAGKAPSKALLRHAAQALERTFDPVYGGFGEAPKFPAPHNLIFLMRYSALEKKPNALEMALRTLDGMARGGIFDHIGGGFSRYSTDRFWLVPHFEKMLYDNALLSLAYLEAYRETRRDIYKTIVTRTLDYVLRELTNGQGAFLCGQDADSGGVEGRYYAVTEEEILNVLGEKDGGIFCARYDITPDGNFEGKNIPNLVGNRQWREEPSRLKAMRDALLVWRRERCALHKDDKVLLSWNALMITAMARAGLVLEEARYQNAAVRACRFIQKHMCAGTTRLYLRWRDAQAANDGQLDDYAFYAGALLALYHTTMETEYLHLAASYAKQMIDRFEDPEGGFFLTASDAPSLITRPKELYDGALPSGNAAAALVLVRLAGLTAEPVWQEAADRQLTYLAGQIQGSPAGHTASLLAMLEVLYPQTQLLCVTPEQGPPPDLTHCLRTHPDWNTMLITPQSRDELTVLAPFTKTYPIPQHGSRYYLCRNGACLAPFGSLKDLEAAIEKELH